MPSGETLDILEEMDQIWHAVCNRYDIIAERPELGVLFEGADLRSPCDAARTVLVNMLSEAIERIGRFSPWYKMPAAAFGLVSHHSDASPLSWSLVPEALCQWADVLVILEASIRRNTGVLLASELVARLMDAPDDEESCVLACCACIPPHIILVERETLSSQSVICNTCHCPYYEIPEI